MLGMTAEKVILVMSNENKPVTIKEVAKWANVSIATVSRVINNRGHYSEATRARVQSVINKSGYAANNSAKSLRMSKSQTVGIIVPDISNDWFSKIVFELERIFFENQYSVFICNTSESEDKEETYFRSLESKLVDGIICISGREVLPTNTTNRPIPIICIDRQPKNFRDVCCIESDHFRGGYLATKELIDEGCTRIAIIIRHESISTTALRYKGYLQALEDGGIPHDSDLDLTIDADSTNNEGAQRVIDELISKGIPFDGIFGTNDWRAYGAMTSLMAHGIRVPEDVRIIGFDDSPIAVACRPSLSTIRQDVACIAHEASRILLHLMSGGCLEESDRQIMVPVSLIRRGTTCSHKLRA
jgi:LacI family transcriptional regulator